MYYSFVMLKPDALERELVRNIISYFLRSGMKIVDIDYQRVTKEKLERHYQEVFARFDEQFKKNMFDYFLDCAVIPIILESENETIIQEIRLLVGKTNPEEAACGSIRGDLGIDSFLKAEKEGRTCHNLIHASDSKEAVKNEISIWFGEEALERLLPL